MKHLLVGAFAGISLLACGSEVVIEGEPSGNAGGGGAGGGDSGASVTTGSSATTGSASIDSHGCDVSCSGAGQSTCSCMRTCTGTTFTKTACKPIPSGLIECVCTVDSGSFSGACYEKNNAACDFYEGCCANYFMGK
jgi:hypothetical protein